MIKPEHGLQSFHLKNFKAVRDSGIITFTPLTVFIGNNGSGKSSVVEGLEMLYTIVTEGLNQALSPWRGFEHIMSKVVDRRLTSRSSKNDLRRSHQNPMAFDLQYREKKNIDVRYHLEITDGPGGNDVLIRQERLNQKGHNVPLLRCKREHGRITGTYALDEEETIDIRLADDASLLSLGGMRLPYEMPLRNYMQRWQFCSFIPQYMGQPVLHRRAGNRSRLDKDGSNIAEYLQDIKTRSLTAFDHIYSILQLVLPYSQDLQIAMTSEVDRSFYLQLTEGGFKVPGWLLSTGTLRILTLLALLHHPDPPPLIIIEEIENGLDPISVQLIVDEMRHAVESGRTQIILTTHSPYLLDLLSLDHVVLVERVDGQPVFSRPGERDDLQEWAMRFGLGTLYASRRLSGKP